MHNMIPVQISDASAEILARIAKAASHNCGCEMEIDFQNGHQNVTFTGTEEMKAYVAGEVLDIFKSR